MLSDDVGDICRYDVGSVMVPMGASSSSKMDPEWSSVKKAWCISKVEKGTMGDGGKRTTRYLKAE